MKSSLIFQDRETLWETYSRIATVLKFRHITLLTAFLLFFSGSVVSNSVTPWTAAHQVSLSFTNSQNLLKLVSIESVMPSSLSSCHTLLLLPSIFPSIRVFSNVAALCIRWLKYWSFSFSISPSNEYSGLISFLDWLVWSPWSLTDSQESSPAPQFKRITSLALSLLYGPTLYIRTWLPEKP